MISTYISKYPKFVQLFIILFAAGFSLQLASCYPNDPISASDTDVVTTFHNAAADFSTKMSYAMPDSVFHIGEDGPVDSNSPALDQQILSAIEANMAQYGYTVEANPDQADVVVVAMAARSTWVSGGCIPWYWGYYYSYPGYCYPVAYTYETGTVLIIMVDPDLAGNGNPADALWIAGMNGLLDGSSNPASRIDRAVDQAFKQSSYLADGK